MLWLIEPPTFCDAQIIYAKFTLRSRLLNGQVLSVKSEEEGGDAEKANAKKVAEPEKNCQKIY